LTSKPPLTDLDRILREFWSFRLYKKGKKPLFDINPHERIRKGIWTDSGVDLTRFGREEGIQAGSETLALLKTSRKMVREGFLRRKTEHMIVEDVADIKHIMGTLFGSPERPPEGTALLGELLSSSIFHPLIVYASCSPFHEIPGHLKPARRKQRPHADLSPGAMLSGERKGAEEEGAGEDLVRLYRRKVDSGTRPRTSSGRVMKDLRDVLRFIYTCRDADLETLISSGSLERFAGEGLKNPYLSAVLSDLSRDEEGNVETAPHFRKRLGRWLLTSSLGDTVVQDLVLHLLSRLRSCPEKEAARLERSASSIMDPRSTLKLEELIFASEPERRHHFIRLLGHTGDRAAERSLRRLMEFSTVKEDRSAAEEAMRLLGVEMKGGGRGKRLKNKI